MLQDNDDQTGIDPLVMAVIVTKTGASSDSPKDIGIVIEGKKVVTGLLAVSSLEIQSRHQDKAAEFESAETQTCAP